jgi:predicted nuclease with TOPRIM domain
MAESTKHERIFLQVCENEDSEWVGEVTWCQDRINDDDVEYIRADLVQQQLADSESVQTLLSQIRRIDHLAKQLAAKDSTINRLQQDKLNLLAEIARLESKCS